MKTFSPKLDKISENIIYLLSLDSKLTVSDISKKLLINRKIAENRINKLYDKGFIKPLLISNYKGLLKATILIKLLKFDKEIIDSIIKIKQLIKLKETLGLYDLSLLLVSENKEDLDKILHQINRLFHKNIQNIEVVIHDSEDTLGYKSFCNNPDLLSRYKMLVYDKDYLVNKQDKIILEILQSKPNIKYTELIKITGFRYKKIKEIISRLLEKEIIRFSIDPDYEKLGLEFHNVLVKINLAKCEQFEKNIINHPRVHWIKKGTGRWDYILSVCARNIGEFIDITRDIRTANKEILFDFSALISKIYVMRKF